MANRNRSRRRGLSVAPDLGAAEHKLVVRMPPELTAALDKLAEREDRSLNAQLVHVAREAVRAAKIPV